MCVDPTQLPSARHALERLQGGRDGGRIFVKHTASIVAAQLLLALALLGGPCLGIASTRTGAQELLKSITLERSGTGGERVGHFELGQHPLADRLGSLIEFLPALTIEREPMAKPQPKGEREQREGEVFYRSIQAWAQFHRDHPFLEALIYLVLGLLVGTRCEASVLAELYRTPRDWVRGAIDLVDDILSARRSKKARP